MAALAELCESARRQVTEGCGRPGGRFAETTSGSRWPTVLSGVRAALRPLQNFWDQ